MKVTCVAIEPFDGHHPGDTVELPERQAQQLEAKGLVKMGLGPRANKMHPGPQENKANPPAAAGQVAPSSALPVAQVSQQTTQQPSHSGRRRGRPPGRSSR
jgi:hypothetical protein